MRLPERMLLAADPLIFRETLFKQTEPLLLLAALGGVALNLLYHMKLLPLPKGIVVGHAVLAVLGFALILVVVFG